MKIGTRDVRFREMALSGNLWKLVFRIGLPLALFNCLNSAFAIIDSFIAASVSSSSVSAVSYLNQLQMIFSNIGAGLAAGGSLLISRSYGEGDYDKVKKNVSTLLLLSTILSVTFLMIIPFSSTVLRMLHTPDGFVSSGARYFAVSMLGIIVSFYNSVYLAIERARGNTKKILYLNMGMLVLKLLLSYIFINYVLSDIIMIALAGLLSQSVLLIYSIYWLFFRDDCFSFSRSSISMKKETLGPLFSLSMPLIIEKSSFSVGKTIVNNMCAYYGEDTIGALGISNNLTSIYNSAQMGMQDGASSLISQNMGGKKTERAISTFYILLFYNFLVSLVGYSILMAVIVPVSKLFSRDSLEFSRLIVDITRYNAIGSFSLFILTSVNALFFGIGKTKFTLVVNILRVFVFRVPVMLYLQRYTSMGAEAAGLTMAISNLAGSMLDAIVAFFLVMRMKRNIRKD